VGGGGRLCPASCPKVITRAPALVGRDIGGQRERERETQGEGDVEGDGGGIISNNKQTTAKE